MSEERPDAVRRLSLHHREFAQLVGAAEGHRAAGRCAVAATYAEVAAQFAWLNHTGAFASPELERVVTRLGQEAVPAAAGAVACARAHAPRTVLHVLTQAYGTGGSTREVECWLHQDSGRVSRVCLTRQGPTPPPASLATRLEGPDDLIRLDDRPGELLTRAARLRALAAGCEVVVLHTHPYDIVPALAFADGAERPPVIYVNHADHVFWVGVAITDVLMNMRESGRALATARRGVAAERGLVMARPLMPPVRTMSRDDAKRRLGLDPDRVLLVTAAAATKYRPAGSPGFLELVAPVIERLPEIDLLAAGPAPEGEWLQAARRSGGRIRALGRLPDVTVLHQAADLYLDSFPFSSLTSLLEAASFGTPAVTLRGHPEECGVLGADTPGVDEHLLRPRTPAELAMVLESSVRDTPWRRDLGARLERTIRRTHTGTGWRMAAAALYGDARAAIRPPVCGPAPRADGRLDVLVDEVMMQTGFSHGVPGALRDHLGLLPIAERLPAAARAARGGAAPSMRHLLPEWSLPHLSRWRRAVRSVRDLGAAAHGGASADAVSPAPAGGAAAPGAASERMARS